MLQLQEVEVQCFLHRALNVICPNDENMLTMSAGNIT